MLIRKLGIIIFTVLASIVETQGSHLRAGEITYKAKPNSPGTFIITLHVWVNTGSIIQFGGSESVLNFGDGFSMAIPEISSTPRPDLGPNIGEVIFSVEHTYSGAGFFVISFSEPNRNEGVLNMDGSSNQRFYTESGFFLDPFTVANMGPELLVPPVDRGCTKQTFFHAPLGVDSNHDSLSYSVVVPQSAIGTTVPNYRLPSHQDFYINYSNGNETGNGPPTFKIDPVTGVLSWDAPEITGEYSVAIKVTEWRKNLECKFTQIGYVIRDMQLIIQDCNNLRPKIQIPNDTCVVSGTTLSIPVYGTDPENHPVKFQAYSDIILNGDATFSPTTPQPSFPQAEATLNWTPTCENAREQYYHIAFRISDNPTAETPLHTYAVWRVKVIPPPPTIAGLELDLPNRKAKISWNVELCRDVSTVQVWRRVADIPYTTSACETGMPSLGYSLIAEVPATNDGFIDTNNGKGLQDGVRYCYRLLGIINNSCGAESLVSIDTCLAPILAEAPIITKVSVEKTDVENGKIRIRWQTPYDRELLQSSFPYQYELYRAEGFEGDVNLSKIYMGPLTDTSTIDLLVNSKALVYNYRVILSWKPDNQTTFIPIDTSSVVSSVRLEGTELQNQNVLQWSASVPWSNALGAGGRHLIYRGTGLTEDGMVLIDSVNVFNGFAYKDIGAYNNTPLDPSTVYSYKIETIGSYGNPKIESPLRNFSQVVWLQPTTATAVCPPSVQIERSSCDVQASLGCDQKEFTNKLSWVLNAGECRVDIVSYNVYAADETGGNYILIGNTSEAMYYDSLLPFPARCYRVTAVNQYGIESTFSSEVCNDNCYYYELPNIFTPNGDGCNDTFSAFGRATNIGGEGCVVAEESRCARYVKNVSIKIFNRWGKEVYAYQSSTEGTIYIDWNGNDKTGKLLPTGTYYYTADVKFISVDPKKQAQTITGWVQLLY